MDGSRDMSPSNIHQMLVALIGRKMRERGYDIVAFDGKDYYVDNAILNIPPKIKRHRPDILGYNFSNNNVCIGESKTCLDLMSKRTKEQLLDFSSIIKEINDYKVELIIGVPKSCFRNLSKLLCELNMKNQSDIITLFLPEELVDDCQSS